VPGDLGDGDIGQEAEHRADEGEHCAQDQPAAHRTEQVDDGSGGHRASRNQVLKIVIVNSMGVMMRSQADLRSNGGMRDTTPSPESDLIPIGDAARRIGVAVSTVRYWDERGVVRPTQRQRRNRWYGEDELHRLAVARLMQDTGTLDLDQISQVLNGPAAGQDWRPGVRARLAEVRDRLEKLRTAEHYLQHLLECPSHDPISTCEHLRAGVRTLLEETPDRRPTR
jgi:MerR family transcriptional regulator, copper efflux regulator